MDNHNKPYVNYKNTTPLNTFSGHPVWQSGYILREMPDPNPENPPQVIPIQVFFDPINGQILDNLLPSEIRGEYNAQYSSNPPQPNQPLNNSWGQPEQEPLHSEEPMNNSWGQPEQHPQHFEKPTQPLPTNNPYQIKWSN